MSYNVQLVEDAERDLYDIHNYVARNDSPEKASRLIDNLEKTILKLEVLPERGHPRLSLNESESPSTERFFSHPTESSIKS